MKVTPVHSAGELAEQTVKQFLGGGSEEKDEEKSGGGFNPMNLISAATGKKDEDEGLGIKDALSLVSGGDKKEEGGETTRPVGTLVIRGAEPVQSLAGLSCQS